MHFFEKMGELFSKILEYLMTNWPMVFIFVAILVFAIWLTIKITTASNKVKSIEKKCESIPCAEHTAKLTSYKEELDRFDKKMDKLDTINDSVVAIRALLLSRYKSAAPLFSQKQSPRRLNQRGEEMFALFGGKPFLDKNEELLLGKIKAKDPQTALDVEQDALEVLYETLDSDIFNEIKLKVYNSKSITIEKDGKEEEYAITMNDICFIFSLDLRDRYLKAHPEVPQEEETSEE